MKISSLKFFISDILSQYQKADCHGELVPRSRVIAVTIPDYVALKPLKLLCGMNLEKFRELG
jgi:hypothetical protein